MKRMNRREVLKRSAAIGLGAGLTILNNSRSARATPANDKVTLAIVGCRGRGNMLATEFAARGDCQFAWFCDVDPQMYAMRAKGIATLQGGRMPTYAEDFRKMLDDRSVDAVVIALPPHWHALATIWCCQAGKDVYCEKPQSHNCWEGRQAIKAARKYSRVVQIGLQNRSASYNIAARKYIAEGKLGQIHLVRVFNQKGKRTSPPSPTATRPPGSTGTCGTVQPPSIVTIPCFATLAFSMAVLRRRHDLRRHPSGRSGPLALRPGVSQVGHLARQPLRARGGGGNARHAGGDDRVRRPDDDFRAESFHPYMLKADDGMRNGEIYPYWPQNTERIEIYGTEGVMYVGRMGAGWQVYVRPEEPPAGDPRPDARQVSRQAAPGEFPPVPAKPPANPMPTSRPATSAPCWCTTR